MDQADGPNLFAEWVPGSHPQHLRDTNPFRKALGDARQPSQ